MKVSVKNINAVYDELKRCLSVLHQRKLEFSICVERKSDMGEAMELIADAEFELELARADVKRVESLLKFYAILSRADKRLRDALEMDSF